MQQRLEMFIAEHADLPITLRALGKPKPSGFVSRKRTGWPGWKARFHIEQFPLAIFEPVNYPPIVRHPNRTFSIFGECLGLQVRQTFGENFRRS
jgi:hypothetical protein